VRAVGRGCRDHVRGHDTLSSRQRHRGGEARLPPDGASRAPAARRRGRRPQPPRDLAGTAADGADCKRCPTAMSGLGGCVRGARLRQTAGALLRPPEERHGQGPLQSSEHLARLRVHLGTCIPVLNPRPSAVAVTSTMPSESSTRIHALRFRTWSSALALRHVVLSRCPTFAIKARTTTVRTAYRGTRAQSASAWSRACTRSGMRRCSGR
jgi:hypothetical protein